MLEEDSEPVDQAVLVGIFVSRTFLCTVDFCVYLFRFTHPICGAHAWAHLQWIHGERWSIVALGVLAADVLRWIHANSDHLHLPRDIRVRPHVRIRSWRVLIRCALPY